VSDRAPAQRGGFSPWTPAAWLRFAWCIASAFAVESVLFGLAILPAELFWEWHFHWTVSPHWIHVVILAMSFIPAYLIFAVSLMLLSALAMRALGWRPPQRAEMRISDLEWPLIDWARYTIANHLVRVFAGSVLRTTPLWNLYMRLNGARLGRRVWINSLDVTDHCLLDFGDDVVIGAGVHLSGHTVERGLVRTAPVRLGHGVTVGLNSSIEIGVEAGPGCQIGAMSVVPKHARLEGHKTYVGIPVHELVAPEPGSTPSRTDAARDT
jgi:acetyltransferase-like isoleucine patch superfamily enzyme